MQARNSTHPGKNPPIPLTWKDLMQIEDTLAYVFEMAEKWRSATTESHWIFVVVGAILSLIGKLSAFHDKNEDSNENITVIDMYVLTSFPFLSCQNRWAMPQFTRLMLWILLKILPAHRSKSLLPIFAPTAVFLFTLTLISVLTTPLASLRPPQPSKCSKMPTILSPSLSTKPPRSVTSSQCSLI